MMFFIYDQQSHQYWVHDLLMRPNGGDVIIDPDGNHWFVQRCIVNFSERIGTHYGVLVSAIPPDSPSADLCNAFTADVTTDVFLNKPGLAIGTAVQGAESAMDREE